MESEQVKLISSDAKEFTIGVNSLNKSKYLLDRFTNGEKVIKLPEINEAVLAGVVDYLTHYTSEEPIAIPAVLSSAELKSALKSTWDVEFIEKFSFELTFHLINAGALLELEHLHNLACARIAAFMKDKQPEDVNKEFTIECQLTNEEAKNLGIETGEEA